MTKTAKRFQVTVTNADGLEFAGEQIDAKLGMRTRPGDSTYINQKLDRMRLQQF